MESPVNNKNKYSFVLALITSLVDNQGAIAYKCCYCPLWIKKITVNHAPPYVGERGNPNLLPYETIVRATSGEPEAVDEVLRHYSKRIRIAAIENGHIDRDTEDSIKSRLVAALFKFRFDEQEV